MNEFRTNGSVLREHLQLDGLEILDVGSGAGRLVRYMTRHGATVVGLECGAAQLAKAYEAPREGSETYVEGFGQDIPLEESRFDVAIFFNSLHHIPPEHMATALKEAGRVTKSSGILYIAEPVAQGSSFELGASIDDETEVRALALQALTDASTSNSVWASTQEITYSTAYYYADYDDFRSESIRIDPAREAIFQASDDAFKAHFHALGVLEEKGYRFDQPMRVNILKKSK